MYDLLAIGLLISIILVLIIFYGFPAFLCYLITLGFGKIVKRENRFKAQLVLYSVCLLLVYPLILATIAKLVVTRELLTLNLILESIIAWITLPFGWMITAIFWTIGAIIFYLKRPRESLASSGDKFE